MRSETTIISRGPQFRGGNAATAFFILFFIIIVVVILLADGDYLPSFFLIVVSSFLLEFVLDFRGVEIDRNNRRIREYRKLFFLRYGEWKPYEGYTSLYITDDYYLVKYSDLTARNIRRSYHVKYHQFIVVLINEDADRNVIVAEGTDYPEVLKRTTELSDEIRLPYFEMKRKENT